MYNDSMSKSATFQKPFACPFLFHCIEGSNNLLCFRIDVTTEHVERTSESDDRVPNYILSFDGIFLENIFSVEGMYVGILGFSDDSSEYNSAKTSPGGYLR